MDLASVTSDSEGVSISFASLFATLFGEEASMSVDCDTGGDGDAVVVEVISLGVGELMLDESEVVRETVIVVAEAWTHEHRILK